MAAAYIVVALLLEYLRSAFLPAPRAGYPSMMAFLVSLAILDRVCSGALRKRLRRAVMVTAVALFGVTLASLICYGTGWEAYADAGGVYGCCGDAKKMAKAARRFDLAWRIFPLDRDAVFYRGDALLLLGRYDEALEAFEWTLRLWPRDFYSHYGMAVCYKHLGDFDAMVRSLRKARSLSRPLRSQARFQQDFAEYENDPRFAEFKDEF